MPRTYNLLYLDDSPAAIEYLQTLLKKHRDQITAQFTGSPDTAIELHQQHTFDIVISDLRLGTTTGIDVIQKMKHFAPDTAYILVSGDADLESALAAVNAAKAVHFMVKPCSEEQLSKALTEAKDHVDQHVNLSKASLTDKAIRQTNTAIISLNRQFNITYINDCARTLLEDNDILSISPTNGLMSSGSLSTNELKDRLKEAMYSPEKKELPFSCASKDFERKLVFYPIIQEETDTPPAEFSFILIDPANAKSLNTHELSAILNLSMSEARVVNHLSLGLSVEETAEACNLSLSTVRTYLKNACAKAGVSRQAEIVGLALRSAI